jgi:hypothetical protein
VEIAKHTHAAVIVSSEWRNVGAVKLFIGASDKPDTVEDGDSVLEAEILDAIDHRGLWIELNSGQKKWPDRPVQKLMVPWKFVGTSSGATAAAHVRSGIPPAELFASILSEPVRPVGQNRQAPPALSLHRKSSSWDSRLNRQLWRACRYQDLNLMPNVSPV